MMRRHEICEDDDWENEVNYPDSDIDNEVYNYDDEEDD